MFAWICGVTNGFDWLLSMSIDNITYVSVCCKPTSNLCNLFCDEFPYFMQFVFCSFVVSTAKFTTVSVFAIHSRCAAAFIFSKFQIANFWLRINSCNIYVRPHGEIQTQTRTLIKVITCMSKGWIKSNFCPRNSFQFTKIYRRHYALSRSIYELIKRDEMSQSFSMKCQII